MRSWIGSVGLCAALAACTGTLTSTEPGLQGREDAGSVTTDAALDASTALDAELADASGEDASTAADAGVDAGPTDPCTGVSCGAGAECDPRTRACACRPGFVDDGTGCVAPPPGDPGTRSDDEVCTAWREGQIENGSPAWTGDGTTCGPGTMSFEGIEDTLRRINVYRWLAGLPPVVDQPSEHAAQMECAAMMSANGQLSHSPPMSWSCYTAGGAGAAGRSNIALGYGTPGAAIAGYMLDRNVESLGHRRWILTPRLGRVGIGFSSSGGRPGQCLSVFDGSGPGSDRRWTAYPNQGPAPIELTTGEWSFQAHGVSFTGSTSATVTRLSDGETMAVMTRRLGGGGLMPTLAMTRQGWNAEAGETYRVTITELSDGELSYDVQVVSCR